MTQTGDIKTVAESSLKPILGARDPSAQAARQAVQGDRIRPAW